VVEWKRALSALVRVGHLLLRKTLPRKSWWPHPRKSAENILTPPTYQNENMITRRQYQDIVWTNLENPTAGEVAEVAEEFAIHPIIAEDLRHPTTRTKAEAYDNCIYLILHFPIFHHHNNQKEYWELDFVIGKKFIITSHYEPVTTIHEFDKIIERDMALDKKKEFVHAGFIFYALLRHLQQTVLEHLDGIADDLGTIEEGIFNGNEKGMVRYIALISHEILDIKRALHNHTRILQSLEQKSYPLFGSKFTHYITILVGQSEKTWEQLEHTKETLVDLRETNDSLLSSKTNEVMKSLTMLALITFPMTLIATIFSMRTEGTPLIAEPQGFWIVVGAMAVLGLSMLGFFKYKKWF